MVLVWFNLVYNVLIFSLYFEGRYSFIQTRCRPTMDNYMCTAIA